MSQKYNVSSISQDYKNNTNKVLRKLNTLGFKINNLDNYLKRKTLLNKKEADIYIDNILKEINLTVSSPHQAHKFSKTVDTLITSDIFLRELNFIDSVN